MSASLGKGFWHGRKVFLTGHTGFKGAWLTMWLHRMGASVIGYSLEPPTTPNLFEICCIKDLLLQDIRADILDRQCLESAMCDAKPDVVFHLAAQPLVRESYLEPVETIATNVLGTAHVLGAIRQVPSVRAALIITTDKCYSNREWVHPYRETDELGGKDPYSASKACAELITSAWRSSFSADGGQSELAVTTARAGNVIGGGDWAKDRLVPDCIRAFSANQPVRLRNSTAVRPWQHVLDPLAGYLQLAEHLFAPDGHKFASEWNFGPDAGGEATVAEISEGIARRWGGMARIELDDSESQPNESHVLRLDSTKARVSLGWQPRWCFEEALDATVQWYRALHDGQNMWEFSQAQIAGFEAAPV